jgi:lysophospholipase L1-like esterase
MIRRTRLTRAFTRPLPVIALLLAGMAGLSAPGTAAKATAGTGVLAAVEQSRVQTASPHWIQTWTAAQTPPGAAGISAAGFSNQTVRMIVHTSAGGSGLRIQLSNQYGGAPLGVGDVSVGVQQSGAAEAGGTTHPLTFGGNRSFVIPAGAKADSDALSMAVPAGENLVVSVYFPGATGPATWHPQAQQVNYLGAGDRTADVGGAGYGSTTSSWFYLDGVSVQAEPVRGTIVAFGDSITDGVGSTVNANHRWPDYLAQRLSTQPAADRLAVADAGIGGNRVLTDAGTCCTATGNYGTSAESRFAGDALAVAGAQTVVFFEGINDIGNNIGDAAGDPLTARQLIDGYRNVIRQAHEEGLTIIGGTLTPYEGFYFYSPQGEQIREQVNQWIRTSGAFDGVVDFDAAVRDPDHPEHLLPAYDSGDHIHPDDAGYRAMANASFSDLPMTPSLSVHDVSPSVYMARAGDTTQFSAQVTNPGAFPAGNVAMTAAGPDGWTITPLATGPGTLAAGQTGTWRWQVTAPAGAQPGRYPSTLTLRFASRGQPGFVTRDLPLLLGVIPHTSMSAAADSAQEPGNDAYYAIDDGPGTIWHSQYSPYQPLPHEITLGLGADYAVTGLRYLPRQDGNHNGVITSYTVSISTDGVDFTPVTSGNWADDFTLKPAQFPAQSARYIRLTALAGHNNLASAAEIDVLGTPGG